MPTSDKQQAILITGNPIDGLTFVGPFDTRDEAIEFGQVNAEGGDWWIANLEPPENENLWPDESTCEEVKRAYAREVHS